MKKIVYTTILVLSVFIANLVYAGLSKQFKKEIETRSETKEVVLKIPVSTVRKINTHISKEKGVYYSSGVLTGVLSSKVTIENVAKRGSHIAIGDTATVKDVGVSDEEIDIKLVGKSRKTGKIKLRLSKKAKTDEDFPINEFLDLLLQVFEFNSIVMMFPEWLEERIDQIEIDPGDGAAHEYRAEVYERKNLYAKAIEEYRIVLETRPENVNGRVKLGKALIIEGLYDEAISELRQVVTSDPDRVDVHTYLAEAYFKKDMFRQAATEYESVLKLEPNDTEAKNSLEEVNKKIEEMVASGQVEAVAEDVGSSSKSKMRGSSVSGNEGDQVSIGQPESEAEKVVEDTRPKYRASHILVPTEEWAKRLLEELRNGADFAKLARENSADPQTAKSGGDLGFFHEGDMLPEFEKVFMELEVDEISEVVRTRLGYHIIKRVN